MKRLSFAAAALAVVLGLGVLSRGWGVTPMGAQGPVIDTGQADYGQVDVGNTFDVEVYINPLVAGGGGAGTGMAGYAFDLVYDSLDLQTVTGSDTACSFGMIGLVTPTLGDSPYSFGCFFIPARDAGAGAGNVLLNTAIFECQQAATNTTIAIANAAYADEVATDPGLGVTDGNGAVVDCTGDATPTPTPTLEPTATATPEPTATATLEPTATATLEPTATATLEPTATATPEPTPTDTPEPTPTDTPEPTATATPLAGVILVDIDVKPGSAVNPINLRSRGVIPVAILTTEDFDATTVDAATVRFGPAEAQKVHKWADVKDVDGDGDLDLVLHFRTQETGIAAGDAEACLTGETFSGTPIRGCDTVRAFGGLDGLAALVKAFLKGTLRALLGG